MSHRQSKIFIIIVTIFNLETCIRRNNSNISDNKLLWSFTIKTIVSSRRSCVVDDPRALIRVKSKIMILLTLWPDLSISILLRRSSGLQDRKPYLGAQLVGLEQTDNNTIVNGENSIIKLVETG